MTDNDISARQLAALYAEGYSLENYERYPRAIGVFRGNCIVLLENASASNAMPSDGMSGLCMLGRPGWRMGGLLGVLVERDGQQVFQYKEELIEATAERLDELKSFTADVERILRSVVR
jgi:hypothetical protein